MERYQEAIEALEDLIIGYADDASSVAHTALVAKVEIERLLESLRERDATVARLHSLLRQAGVEAIL